MARLRGGDDDHYDDIDDVDLNHDVHDIDDVDHDNNNSLIVSVLVGAK
jgi:hypothetical protein